MFYVEENIDFGKPDDLQHKVACALSVVDVCAQHIAVWHMVVYENHM